MRDKFNKTALKAAIETPHPVDMDDIVVVNSEGAADTI